MAGTRLLAILMLAGVIGAGCKPGASDEATASGAVDETSASDEVEMSAADCQAEADELGRFLTAMDHEPSMVYVGDDTRLITRTDLTRFEVSHAPTVEITASGETVFEGALVSTAELGERLEARAAQAAHFARPDRDPRELRRVYLAFDEATSWASVVATVEAAAQAGFDAPVLVFARPPASPPPPPSAIDRELDEALKAAPSERATMMAQKIETLVVDCSPLIRLFGSVAAVPGANKAEHLLAGVGPAVAECDCKVDIPTLRSAMWHMAGNPRPMSFLALELAADATPVTWPAATPWREANAKLGARTGTTWLAVAAPK